ncbi:MAG: YdeI/OmpD-associated family protein [Chloroflexota bacterium]|nr:YdeI/OmpD-associated family protein [Chloroflexota bacterium]
MPDRPSRLTRPLNPMPAEVERALEDAGLMEAYQARPPYQRNDYLGWIDRARRPETKARRLRQMLDELARGDVYMKMAWRARPRI